MKSPLFQWRGTRQPEVVSLGISGERLPLQYLCGQLLASDRFVTDRSNDLIGGAGTKPVHNERHH